MAKGARLAFVCLAVFALFAPFRTPAGAVEGSTVEAEQRFVGLANGERTSRGLAALEVAPDLVDVARRHAARMAAERRLHHNPNLAAEVDGWEAIGENVGTGMDADQVHVAFMNSATHRDNILSRVFTEIGVGVAPADDGGLWVAQVFRKPAAPAPAESAETQPAPEPTTTTSTPPESSEQPPPTVRAASARRAAAPAPTTTVAPEPSTTTTEAPAPAAQPDTVPVVVPMSETVDQVQFDAPPATSPNPGTVRLSAQPVSFTSEPEVSFAIVAGAGLLLAVVATQTATLRRLRLI